MNDWNLEPGSGVPLYVQLRQQIIGRIVRGEWVPGLQLPTVRQLAVDLRINVNTVSKVYSQVEQEGYIQTHQGKGTFVRDEQFWNKTEGDREEQVRHLAALVREMASAQGISLEELLKVLKADASS